jgi:hypothetical protein
LFEKSAEDWSAAAWGTELMLLLSAMSGTRRVRRTEPQGLEDRRQAQGILEQAQELMADAIGAEEAFFSTCGSSLSVKRASRVVLVERSDGTAGPLPAEPRG